MADKQKRRIEKLIRAASDSPPPARELRTRVMDAAFAAQTRRSLSRRMLGAACLLLPMLGTLSWYLSRPSTLESNRVANNKRAAHSSQTDAERKARVLSTISTSSDWALVDATIRSRKKGLRSLRKAF